MSNRSKLLLLLFVALALDFYFLDFRCQTLLYIGSSSNELRHYEKSPLKNRLGSNLLLLPLSVVAEGEEEGAYKRWWLTTSAHLLPRVYIYNPYLILNYSFEDASHYASHDVGCMYAFDLYIVDYFINHYRGVRVTDPLQADFFIVPFYTRDWLYNKQARSGIGQLSLDLYLNQHVRASKQWKRRGGRDHVILASSLFIPTPLLHSIIKYPAGTKETAPEMLVTMEWPRPWSHSGVLPKFERVPTNVIVSPMSACPSRELQSDVWLTDERQLMQESKLSSSSSSTHSRHILVYLWCNIDRSGTKQRQRAALKEIYDQWMQRADTMPRLQHRRLTTHVEIFSGSSPPDITNSTSLYASQQNSIFCIIPEGDNHISKRLFDALRAGCVPVIVHEQIRVPFARFYPVSEYALLFTWNQVKEAGVGLFDRLLEAANDSVRLARLRRRIARLRTAFTFFVEYDDAGLLRSRPRLGDAFHHIVDEVLMRICSLQAEEADTGNQPLYNQSIRLSSCML